jgi:hypothetical protein
MIAPEWTAGKAFLRGKCAAMLKRTAPVHAGTTLAGATFLTAGITDSLSKS